MNILSSKGKTNIAVDAIIAAIQHYKRCSREIKTITLCPLWFVLFKDYMKENAPGLDFDDMVKFNSLIIQKGAHIMHDQRMKVELIAQIAY
jgi:hypothetical protein